MSGCRKGPEDPFFSIYSREKRLCGDWFVYNCNYVYEEFKNQVSSYKQTMVFKNGVFTENFENSNIEYYGTYSYEYIINKNGTYKINESLNYTKPHDTTLTRSEEGNWYFVDKNQSTNHKNKETVAFQPSSVIYSPTNTYTLKGYNPYFYDIIKLKNDEVKLNRSYSENQDTIVIKLNEDIDLLPK